MATKKEIRDTIKKLGFKSSIRKHPLIDNAVTIHVSELGIGDGNVFGGDAYEQHKDVFEYVNSLSKTFLYTGEKVI